MRTVYGFEAKSIQDYIFRTNKLAYMVGASSLVASLSEGLLDSVLESLNLEKGSDFEFARKGGGAFRLVFKKEEEAKLFRNVWGLKVQLEAPGLKFVHGLATGPEPEQVDNQLAQLLNVNEYNRQLPILPTGSPIARRDPLTNNPAVATDKGQSLDADLQARSRVNPNLEECLLGFDQKTLTMPLALHPEKAGETNPASSALDCLIKDREEGNYVAIIHADGNDLGNILAKVRKEANINWERYIRVHYEFSNAINKATQCAAKKALQVLTNPRATHPSVKSGLSVIPARFLVLGGDDLTLVVKADLALTFLEEFVVHFEEETKKAFTYLKSELNLSNLPQKMTACAGIAYVKVNHPFHMAYHLCESLCQAAKAKSKKVKDECLVPSSLAFHRVTASLFEDWNTLVQEELTTRDGLVWTMQPYSLGKDEYPQLPTLSHLKDLADLLEGRERTEETDKEQGQQKEKQGTEHKKGSSIRELARLAYEGKGRLGPDLRRWKKNLEKHQPEKGRQIEDRIKTLLCRSGQEDNLCTDLPIFSKPEAGKMYTPLADALALKTIGYHNLDEFPQTGDKA